MDSVVWQRVLSPPLPSGELHVWLLDLHRTAKNRSHLTNVLSSEELRRAAQLEDRDTGARFIVRRGMLRVILARYLECAPAAVDLAVGRTGKPELARGFGETLRFNMGSSGRWALLAVARDLEVGVDVERLRRGVDMQLVADRRLTADQSRWIFGTVRRARRQRFFTCWTRTEAWLKANGTGLAGREPPENARIASFRPLRGYVGAWAAVVESREALVPRFLVPAETRFA